jgi:hypothetical protein
MGRLLQAKQVRYWIRGRLPAQRGRPLRQLNITSHKFRVDPTDILTGEPIAASFEFMKYCFTPSVASVITISAPQILLSASLLTLLLGLGMYLGFVWTRHLDIDAGKDGSRNVLIFYLISLTLCFVVYSISGLIQDDDTRTERMTLLEYTRDFVEKYNADVARQQGAVNANSNEVVFVGNRAEGPISEANDVPTSEAANIA